MYFIIIINKTMKSKCGGHANNSCTHNSNEDLLIILLHCNCHINANETCTYIKLCCHSR